MRTQRGKEHEGGKGDGPDIHGVGNIATVELEEPGLDTCMGERGTKQRTDQKTIGQPIGQGVNDILNNTVRFGDIGPLDFTHCSKYTWGPAIVNVGKRLNVELHHGSYGHKREHRHSVGYDPPFDRLPSAIDGVKQRGHTLEEHRNDDP